MLKSDVAKCCVAQSCRLLPDAFSPLSEDPLDSAQRGILPEFDQCGQNPTAGLHSVRKREKAFDAVQSGDLCTVDIHEHNLTEQLSAVATLLPSDSGAEAASFGQTTDINVHPA